MKQLSLKAGLLTATLLLVGAGSAVAHHSFAMFDREKQLTLEGTVREFQWTNPHVFIQVMVKNPAGVEEEWSVEGASPNMLFRRGWTNQSFKHGDHVTIIMNPLRDGTHGGSFVFARLPDGKTLGEMNSRAPG
jgi:Family of unknown function (DUF6152)